MQHEFKVLLDALKTPALVVDLEGQIFASNQRAQNDLLCCCACDAAKIFQRSPTFPDFLRRCASVNDELKTRVELHDGAVVHWIGSAVRPSTGGVYILLRQDTTHRINVMFQSLNRKIDTLHRTLHIERMRSEGLERESHTDSLTGLSNRRGFEHHATKIIAAAKREFRAVALAYIDLDKFKPINDCYGHEAGDCVLKTIGNRLKETLRRGDVGARLGGDEFAVLYSTGVTQTGVDLAVARLTARIEEPIVLKNGTVRVGASAGTALMPYQGHSFEALMRTADAAMYAAKSHRQDPNRAIATQR